MADMNQYCKWVEMTQDFLTTTFGYSHYVEYTLVMRPVSGKQGAYEIISNDTPRRTEALSNIIITHRVGLGDQTSDEYSALYTIDIGGILPQRLVYELIDMLEDTGIDLNSVIITSGKVVNISGKDLFYSFDKVQEFCIQHNLIYRTQTKSKTLDKALDPYHETVYDPHTGRAPGYLCFDGDVLIPLTATPERAAQVRYLSSLVIPPLTII